MEGKAVVTKQVVKVDQFTLTLSGKELAWLRWITRLDITIPDQASRECFSKQEARNFLRALQGVIDSATGKEWDFMGLVGTGVKGPGGLLE